MKGISFSRNFGHHIAITAGIDSARGNTVILMDGDLQDPPEEIPVLFEKFREGYDIVYGIRRHREDPLLKKMSSSVFWWILRKFSGVDIPQGQTMLRILSRRLIESMKGMREHARFIHGMMAWAGFRTATVTVRHEPRTKGKSKYNVPKMFRLAFHAVTSFSISAAQTRHVSRLPERFGQFSYRDVFRLQAVCLRDPGARVRLDHRLDLFRRRHTAARPRDIRGVSGKDLSGSPEKAALYYSGIIVVGSFSPTLEKGG